MNKLLLYVIGDSTTARIHHLFKKEFGNRYDRFRGTAYNTKHDGTWNCKNTQFIIDEVLPEAANHVGFDTSLLVNAGLWDIGVHLDKPMISKVQYKDNIEYILEIIVEWTNDIYFFETLLTMLPEKNKLIKEYNEILKDICWDWEIPLIPINEANFTSDMYEPEGYHLNDKGNKELYDIIVPSSVREYNQEIKGWIK